MTIPNTTISLLFSDVQPLLPERAYVMFGYLLSQIRLSSVEFVRPTQGRQYFFAILYLSRPFDLCAKFNGDPPMRTPPSGALNARRVAAMSRSGLSSPIEFLVAYIHPAYLIAVSVQE